MEKQSDSKQLHLNQRHIPYHVIMVIWSFIAMAPVWMGVTTPMPATTGFQKMLATVSVTAKTKQTQTDAFVTRREYSA